MKKILVFLAALMMILPAVAFASDIPLAGWRSSAYGYQTGSPPSYWINVANDISSKFPGTSPGGIWLVGETDGYPATGTLLYMPSSGSYPNIRFEGGDISEPYLDAFDSAGVKIILQVEPMNANISDLIDIVMNRYKHHTSVIGFGVDNEWYKTCSDGCKATAEEVIFWNNKLHSINPNYILMIKHFDESKLPTGIPSDILVLCDDEDNGNLGTLVSEHEAVADRFPGNPFGAQYGYPSDENIWGGMDDPVFEVGEAVASALSPRAISFFWVDFSIEEIYPPSTWDECASGCDEICTPKTCANYPNQCGTLSDGCGATLDCGCPSGKFCSAGTCVADCVPRNCSYYPGSCGTLSDGCGGSITCNICSSNQTCVGNICQNQSNSCIPATCSSIGASCGSHDDGCGATLDCGTCAISQGGGGGGSYCVLKRCADFSNKCGNFIDGCGGSIQCGCQSGKICVNETCVSNCTPSACSNFVNQCGSLSDGCGATITCGCSNGSLCVDSSCILCSSNKTCGSCDLGLRQCFDLCGNVTLEKCAFENSSSNFWKDAGDFFYVLAGSIWNVIFPWLRIF